MRNASAPQEPPRNAAKRHTVELLAPQAPLSMCIWVVRGEGSCGLPDCLGGGACQRRPETLHLEALEAAFWAISWLFCWIGEADNTMRFLGSPKLEDEWQEQWRPLDEETLKLMNKETSHSWGVVPPRIHPPYQGQSRCGLVMLTRFLIPWSLPGNP